jgi:ABC-type uncharacterized transport system substrate-binding protein
MFNFDWRRLIQALAAVAMLASATQAPAAEPPDRVVHVGFLSLYPREVYRFFDIVDELAKLGNVEGRNLVIDSRDCGGGTDRLTVAALELVKLKVDVIFAVTNPAASAARNATGTIAIVAWGSHGAVQTVGVRQQIFDFAAARRLSTMCEFKFLVEAGCLMSYGPTFDEFTQRSAAQIDRILRGTPPGELPIEQPTRFELAINPKTARALGLTVPQELLLRADAVVE